MASLRESRKKAKEKGSLLNTTLYNIQNTYSLDFETTGTGSKSSVWSVGMTGGKESNFNLEFFLEDAIKNQRNLDIIEGNLRRPATIEEQLLQAHKDNAAEHFGQRQMEAGSFRPFQDALVNGKGSTLNEAFQTFNEHLIKNPGIILIQNANFENQRLLDALQRREKDGVSLSQQVADRLVADVLGRTLGDEDYARNIINVSKETLDARKALGLTLDRFKTEYTTPNKEKNLEEVYKAKANLRDIINNEVKAKVSKGYSVPIELMDLTTMLHIDLAERGMIDPKVINYGRSMEVLAEYLLNEAETHRALDDTHKQVDVYKTYRKATASLESGKVPNFLQPYIKAINENENNIHDTFFLKNIRNRVEEHTRQGKRLYEKDLDKIISSATDHYLFAPETNVDRHLVAAKIKESFTQAENNTGAAKVLQIIDDFQERIPKLNGTEPLIPTGKPSISQAMRTESKIALGLGSLAALGIISASTDRKKEVPKPTTYNELYDNVELGSAYADWKERNGAYKSIY